MKKLKTYKRFLESNSEHFDEVMSVLNDMCLELRDKGFVVEPFLDTIDAGYALSGLRKTEDVIVINILKQNDDDWRSGKRFYFNDIKESILEMIEYITSEGLFIKDVEFVDAAGYLNGVIKDDNLYTKLTGSEVNHLIGNFLISFSKSNKTNESSLSERPIGSKSEYSFEEDKDFISDTLLELEDKGYYVKISPDGISNNISIDEPMPYFIISSENKSHDFKFSDVKEEILQIKSYLDDRWFKCGVVFEGDPIRIEVYIDEKGYDHLDDWFQTSTTAIVNLAVFFNI